MLFFSDRTIEGTENTGRRRLFKAVATVTATALLWLAGPYDALARITFDRLHPLPKAHSLLKDGLTQTPDADLQAKIDARETAQRNQPRPDFRPLTENEKKGLRGRGPNRDKYLSGAPLPWHRSFRDVNLSTGNLFKSFTDIQIAPAKGAGLVLQRTYNSQDEREGPFGVGWTHAYDIRMEEASGEIDAATGDEIVPRTDFFGGKHKYIRDADGLYTPPPYLFDEMDSRYNTALINGLPPSLEDIDKGMDGTIKHFVLIGTKADGTNVRACDTITDRHGNTTTLTYGTSPVTMADGSSLKLLQSVTDPTNRTLTFTWQNRAIAGVPHWRITGVQGPTGTYSVAYDYDASNNLSAVHLDSGVGGLNRTTTYGYTSVGAETGLLNAITDPLGHTVTYAYGAPASNPVFNKIWVQSVTEPAGVTTGGTPRTLTISFAIVAFGSTNYGGGVYSTDVTIPYVSASSTIRCESDNRLRVTDVYASGGFSGHYRTFYDTSNNVTKSYVGHVGASGSDLNQEGYTATYTAFGAVLTQQPLAFAAGKTTTTYYDASKYFQKASVTDAFNRTTTMDYYGKYDSDTNLDNIGEARWVRDANYAVAGKPSYGKQFSYTYANQGQKASETDLRDTVTQYTYGTSGVNLNQLIQVKRDVGGLNRITSMTYDAYGRVATSTDASGLTSSFLYNTLGQPTQASFPARGATAAETITYNYEGNGRMQSVIDGHGTVALSYEANCDRVSSVTDTFADGNAYTTSYTYLPTGERKTLTTPGSATATYLYWFEYNTSTSSGGCLMPGGKPDSVVQALMRITDASGRRVDLDWVNNDATYAHNGYDIAGKLARITYDQTFDGGGTLVSYCRTYLDYGYTGGSQGNLAYTITARKLAGVGQSQATLFRNNYTYSNAGQRLTNQITDNSGGASVRTELYGYDELNRLKTVDYGDGQTQQYDFDAMGNRSSKSDTIGGSTVTEAYSYDKLNELTARASNSYTSDTVGNTLTGGGRTNTWDSQNRLVKCVTGSGASQKTSTFTYGSDGLRRSMNVQTGDVAATAQYSETRYILDSTNVVQEQTRQKSGSGGSWTAWASVNYLMGPSGPLARLTANAVDARWYVYDGLGSVLAEVDVNGAVQGSRKYDVYGATRSYTGTPLGRQAFVGQLGHATDDETGLTYMRARYYDNQTGRFVSEDPAKHGMNWFAYCNNDPLNLVDASGRNPIVIGFLIVALLGAIGGLGFYLGKCGGMGLQPTLSDALWSMAEGAVLAVAATVIAMLMGAAMPEVLGVGALLGSIMLTFAACIAIGIAFGIMEKTSSSAAVSILEHGLALVVALATCDADMSAPGG